VTDTWITETLHPGYGQSFAITNTLYHQKTAHQELAIHDTLSLGRVLVLDGIVQTTEVDEFYYHEMMAHLAIIAHGDPRRVLVIGGGDGGVLREVLKHPNVEQATMVEIDASVVALCREHLPTISAGAFDDPRARLIIADGTKFVADTDEDFDIVIIDSTDPIGPSVPLFDTDFYRDCRRIIGKNGILLRQAGVPFFQQDVYVTAYQRLSTIFDNCALALVPVPTYCGGHMALAWGSDNHDYRKITLDEIADRIRTAGIETRYYNAEIHQSAFALPQFMKTALGQK
jgi:spermidine synthase